jgi:ribosome recycling factor
MTDKPLKDLEKQADEAMTKAVENTQRELATIRSGKATTNLLDTVKVDAYGQHMPLNQVATVSAPEPRLLVVQPWDRSLMQAVEKAIQSADLGLNPANDGTVIRVPLPALTEERRKELVKVVHKLAEEGRIGIRHARTDTIAKIKKVEHVSDDDKHRADKEIQKQHDDAIHRIEELVKTKEQEIMEV